MAKLNIDFVLLDESVVMNGFRCKMSGARLEEFKRNPVMLVQHNRPKEYSGREDLMLPIGKWYDIRVEGVRLLAKPDFDDNDELAVKVQKKVEGGYMNAASIWVVPIKCSDDDADMLPGQHLPTFTEWSINEASIVDIPNCKNALAIRNEAGEPVRITLDATSENDTKLRDYLHTLIPQKNIPMLKAILAKLGLPENATEEQVTAKLAAVMTPANNALQTENESLKAQVIKLQGEINESKVTALLEEHKGKFPATEKENWQKLAAKDFDMAKQLLEGMKPTETMENKLSAQGSASSAELDTLIKLSGNELYMSGQLERLKSLSMEHFKLKYKEAFGCEYKGEK